MFSKDNSHFPKKPDEHGFDMKQKNHNLKYKRKLECNIKANKRRSSPWIISHINNFETLEKPFTTIFHNLFVLNK